MSTQYWVRHGPTHQKTFVGWRDVPADLSDHAAIARLAAAVPEEATVVSSDLVRAIATADAIETDRTRLCHHPGLREMQFGAWEGRSFAEIEARWPDLSRAFWEHPGEVRPPGGESWHEASERVSVAADHLRRSRPGPMILVAHIGAILTQVQRALRCSAEDVLAHRIDNLSITEIHWSGARARIGRINHLA